jgi:hypothetical protein
VNWTTIAASEVLLFVTSVMPAAVNHRNVHVARVDPTTLGKGNAMYVWVVSMQGSTESMYIPTGNEIGSKVDVE